MMNETTPKISVIVPVYKAEAYLHRCVDSLLAQTFQDFEILLVDDGSPDKSGEICDEYARKDKRVRVFHKENGGAGAARKHGVTQAVGEWIMFVDSDDTIPHNAIERLYDLHSKYEADIVCGTVNFSNRFIFKHKQEGLLSSIEYINALLLDEVFIGPVAKIIRKSLFVLEDWNTDKEIQQNEDLLMLIILSKYAKSIYIDPNIVCYNYLQRDDSISSYAPPLDIWCKLFSFIKKQIQQMPSSTHDAIHIYELRRIYYNIFLMNVPTNYKDNRIESIKRECSQIELHAKERYILFVLSNRYLRCIDFYLHKLKYTMKNSLQIL